jgi:hypothetical protein
MVYGGGNVVFNKITPDDNTSMNLRDGRTVNTYYTLQFEDDTITTTKDFIFIIGDENYVPLAGDDDRLTADKKKQLFFISAPPPKDEVWVVRDRTIVYSERERTPGNPALIFLRPVPIGFDLIGEITEVNQKILYNDSVYQNYSHISGNEADEITFFVHGESESDVPDYWYIWYKDGVKVDEGINKNAYTVNWQSYEDVSGYSVELKPFDYQDELLLPEIIPNAKLTGIEKTIASPITVRRQSNYVIVDTPEKETVSIYDASGMLIQKTEKEAGQIHIDLGNYRHKNFLIVKGQGWVRKVN